MPIRIREKRPLEQLQRAGKLYRERHKEKCKAYGKQWRLTNKDKIKAYRKRYRTDKSTAQYYKQACRAATTAMVKMGFLTRKNCFYCGASESVIHHNDYKNPLDITWLCSPCHRKQHSQNPSPLL
jgi:hypothetical protein